MILNNMRNQLHNKLLKMKNKYSPRENSYVYNNAKPCVYLTYLHYKYELIYNCTLIMSEIPVNNIKHC